MTLYDNNLFVTFCTSVYFVRNKTQQHRAKTCDD
jgi:hypothetical protein